MVGKNKLLLLTVAFICVAVAGCIDGQEQGEDVDMEDPTQETEQAPAREPNAEVSGDNSSCAEMVVAESGSMSPLGDVIAISVEAGTTWKASGNGAGVHVEFFDADGAYLDHGDNEGIVPDDAVYGAPCVVDDMFLPTPDGSWTYQDGFE
jgi:hypothetical protein